MIGLTVPALRATARNAFVAGSPRAASSARRAVAGFSASTVNAPTREPPRAAIARRSPRRTTESRSGLKFIQLAYGTNPRPAKLSRLPDPRPLEHRDGVAAGVGTPLDDGRQAGPYLALDQAVGLDSIGPSGERQPPSTELAGHAGVGALAPALLDGRALGVAEVERSEDDARRGVEVDLAGRLHGDVGREAGLAAGAVVDRRRHALDLQQLGDRVEVAVLGAVGQRQLEVVVFALRAVDAIVVVGIAPVLKAVADGVALGLVETERQEQPVHAVGGGGVEVEARLLVGGPVGELADAQRHVGPRPALELLAVAGVEGQVAVLGQDRVGDVARDLPNGLLDGRLGEVGGGQRVLVGAHGGGLEPHRVGELGAQHADHGQHEEHGDEGEAAPAAHRTAPVVRSVTVMGGSVCARPLTVAPSFSCTPRGIALTSWPSQVSTQSPSSFMNFKASEVMPGSRMTISAFVNGSRFGSARLRTTRPVSSPDSSELTTTVKAMGAASGSGGACVTNSSFCSTPLKSITTSGASPFAPRN